MDINLSPVAVSGRRRQTTTTTRTPNTTRIKPSQSCHSCSDDQHSFTSDDREKSLNSCFTDNDSNPFPSGHAQTQQRHHLPQSSSILHNHHHHHDHDENNHADRDLDSPDQDYDFNSRFSPPPTDNSYHSENHCQCYENDADDTDSEPDFIGSGVESGGRTRQFRQKRRTGGGGGGVGHRNCTMGEDDELVVTQDTVCIIESEARGGVSSARELNEKTMASKGRLPKTTGGGGVVGGLSPGSKSYHNICGTALQPGNGRSYELAKNGQSANFGTVSGSDVASGKLLDKVCINNSCSAGGCCNKRPPGASMVEAVLGGVSGGVPLVNSSSSSSNNRSNRKTGGGANNNQQHHGGPDGINEFMHGPMGGGAPGAAPAMQMASYGPQVINYH